MAFYARSVDGQKDPTGARCACKYFGVTVSMDFPATGAFVKTTERCRLYYFCNTGANEGHSCGLGHLPLLLVRDMVFICRLTAVSEHGVNCKAQRTVKESVPVMTARLVKRRVIQLARIFPFCWYASKPPNTGEVVLLTEIKRKRQGWYRL